MTNPRAPVRKNFSKFKTVSEIPHLLEVQIDSYRKFLQDDLPPHLRKKQGLQAVFQEIFPVVDVHENYSLEFVSYSIGKPRYSVEECRIRNITYAGSIRVKLRLVVNEATAKSLQMKETIESEVYLGEMALITPEGTFIINGAERVIVSQLHRSPGVFFDEATHSSGKKLFSARIIPFRGSWLEFTLDVNDVMHVHIDSRRKIPVSVLLRALGYSTNHEILKLFYNIETRKVKTEANKVLAGYAGETIVNPDTGEIILDGGDPFTESVIEKLKELQIAKVQVITGVRPQTGDMIVLNTLGKDPTDSTDKALEKIYAALRPGEPLNPETAKTLMEKLFFSVKRYDLGEVGRYKINQRLGCDIDLETTVLHMDDFINIIRYLVRLRNGEGIVDDIDHLGSRRVRTVGELLENQFRIGLARMARTIKERMRQRDNEHMTPADLVNARTVSAVLNTFFGSSQLSQFMDQHNPLAELTHKRRLSALGPGGLSRERAGFEVRDVHHTHYGRMCPVETPEGPNIGLIASLATYARVNKYGFIESPYRGVKDGIIQSDIVYMTADEEDRYLICQATVNTNDDGLITEPIVRARQRGDFPMLDPHEVSYMDVSPNQIVSVAAALIPFLEHDDANRALMGSNMQRQAVPLLITDAPVVGTGIEAKVAEDSGAVVLAERDGVVVKVDAKQIVIKPTQDRDHHELLVADQDVYTLRKFQLSNQTSCINQRPIVAEGEVVSRGTVIADGSSTCNGELALGRNLMVAFMPWWGYNFEDAIIVSEDLVKNDIFTSIHIEKFELQVRETKRGPEEITREIPNVSEEAIANLDERGVIRVGAEIEAGDILVGKVTPKGETDLTPEERLLRAIFGDKAGDVKDVSLKAPPGMKGVVIDTMVFSRKQQGDDARRKEKKHIAELTSFYTKEIEQIKKYRADKLAELLKNQVADQIRRTSDQTLVIKTGTKLAEKITAKFSYDDWESPGQYVLDEARNELINLVLTQAERLIGDKQEELANEIDKIQRGEELPVGVIQLIKVMVATKRKLSIGDKMAGRHGNKGVVSKIVPTEDLPYMPDGSPVDIILNPLGVPSRMNVGQILETHLGWAAAKLGIHVASPVFSGASVVEIKEHLRAAGLPESGKISLRDGKTGEPFAEDITVGIIYILKLAHLADDKIHARSIGPYSLVTQQPLGGKAQFGGQRFGEMEVWALEAYGAAYTLQEMLTVKSDDVLGRSKIYEAIVKGENPPEPGTPESFNVLVKELQSLCLDVQLEEEL